MRRPVAYVALLALALAASPADAGKRAEKRAAKRAARQAEKELAVTASGTVGTITAAPAVAPAGGEIVDARARALEAYRNFLETAPGDSPLRADALRRLGDLELETAERRLSGDEAAPAVDFGAAVTLYSTLLADYPDAPRRDHVLYQLAHAQENDGDIEGALTTLTALVEQHPGSVHADEAWFRRGEILFQQREYAEAETSYAQVVAYGEESRFHDNALYKHGWSAFKRERYTRGLNSFVALLDGVLGASTARDPFADLGRARREMLDDALRATSISFTALGGAEAAGVYLDERAADGEPGLTWEHLLFDRLGELYLEQERYADAAAAFGTFAARRPAADAAPVLQARVIEAYTQGGFADRVLEAKATFVTRYGFDQAYWASRERDDHPEVVAQLKQHLTDLAGHHHAVAQATGATADYGTAAGWYRTWLESFPDEPETAGKNFLLAEVLYESGDAAGAAEQYERTAYAYLPHEHGAEAGYAAVLAWREAVEAAVENPERAAALRQRALDNGLRFAATYAEDPRAGTVLVNTAEELYRQGDLGRAVQAATDAVAGTLVISPDERRTAWIVLAHGEFDRGRYAEAEAAYAEALALLEAGDDDRLALSEKLAASIYRQGEALRDAGSLPEAVAAFERVAAVGVETSVHAVARFDAANVLVELEQWERAAQSLEDFRSRYPDHELNDGIGRQLAGLYVEAGRPAAAAGELEAIAAAGVDAGAAAALWEAQRLYEKAGDRAARVRVLEQIVRTPLSSLDESMRARETLLAMATETGDGAAERRWHDAIIAADAAAGEARTDYSRTLAGRSALELTAPLQARYDGLSLTLPIEQSLPRKKQALEDALAAYERAADYGVIDVTTQATFAIAELYGSFGAALMESERPEELSADELEEYEFLLEDQAFPFEEKAIEIHEVNAARTGEGVYDDWVQRSFGRLAELMPGRYARIEQSENWVAQLD